VSKISEHPEVHEYLMNTISSTQTGDHNPAFDILLSHLCFYLWKYQSTNSI